MRRDRPIFVVKVYPDGRKGRVVDVSERVESFMYLDRSTKADRLEIKVNNSDLRYFDDPVFRKGVLLEVAWGYPGDMSASRWCVIKKAKGGVDLTIEGLSQGILLHQVKKCRVWKNVTLQDLADKMQAEYQDIMFVAGAMQDYPKVLDTPVTNLKIIHATQAAVTDAEFLARQARKFGYIFRVDPQTGKIRFHSVDTLLKKPPMRTITWRGGTGDWENFNLDNDITALFGSVIMKGIDTKTGAEVGGKASNKETKRTGLSQTVEICDQTTGVYAHEQRNISESVETGTAAEAGKEQLQLKAEGKFKASQRVHLKVEGTLIGDPQLAAMQNIEVNGLGKRLSGKYHLIQVRHKIEKGAYRTDFVMKRDGDGGYSASPNVVNDASQNKTKAVDTDVDKVEQQEFFDQPTGQVHYEFHLKGK